MIPIKAALAVAMTLVAPAATAQVYRCTEGGRTVYSDKPCTDPTGSVTVPVPSRATEPPGPNLQLEANLGRVAVGMTPAQVETAWGKPRSINTRTDADGRTDQWVYRRDGGNAYVYFQQGRVSSISTNSTTTPEPDPSTPSVPRSLTRTERESIEREDKAAERRHIAEGLASGTVRGRLGEPERRGYIDGLEYWTYGPTGRDAQTRTTIWFQDGRVRRVDRAIER